MDIIVLSAIVILKITVEVKSVHAQSCQIMFCKV